jgi:hypothetical protein
MDVLKEEYVKARPGEVVSVWFSFGGSSGAAVVPEGVDETKQKEDGDVVEDFDFTEDDTVPAEAPAASAHSSVSAGLPKQQFTDFLPDFYEAVLDLLVKERNQARTVFGPEMAPSIVVKVLMECFKPIVSSFGTRLETSASAGGMEAIAMAFESTVQFLSLAFDQIEAWEATSSDAQGMVANKDGGNNDRALLEAIRDTFLLIASPFVPYQQSLAEVERDPLGEAASIVARDIRA